MKSIWNFLNSLKLTVYLILAITGMTVFGSLVLYARPDIYGDMDSDLLFHWLSTRGLEHMGSAWWLYVLVLMVVLLGLNTLVCTIERLPALAGRYLDPLMNLRDMEIGGGAGRRVELGGGGAAGLAASLEKNRYRVFTEGGRLYAEKNRWVPFMPYVVHAGILVFMVAHLISGLFGYRNSGLFILEGQTVKSPSGGYELRLDKVDVEFRPDGSLKDFGSRLTAIKDGEEISTGRTSANSPMFVGGSAVYQRQFGQTTSGMYISAEVGSAGYTGRLYITRGAEFTDIPGTGYRVRVEDYLPDFAVTRDGRPVTRSDNPANPAALVMLYREGRPVARGWLFLRQPELDNFSDPDVRLKLSDIEVKSFSSFDVNRDPSALTALFASVIVMFGTLVTLYFRRERVWATLDEASGFAQVQCTDDELYDRL